MSFNCITHQFEQVSFTEPPGKHFINSHSMGKKVTEPFADHPIR